MKINQSHKDYSIFLNSGLFQKKEYRVEEYLKNVTNINESVKNLFKTLNLKYNFITSSVTRYEFDDSDFTAWTMFYGDNKYKEMKEDISKILELKVEDKPIFSVSGNGFGTGLSIMSNLSTKYD